MKAIPQPGEVWLVDFGYDGKFRPSLVVSVADPNSRLALSTVVQVTKQHGGTPYEVVLPRVPWLPEQSHCNVQSLQPVKWIEFQRKVGQFDTAVLKQIRAALARWVGI